ncbi:MAG: hypothetical protein ACOVVK_15790 [Elsteraceae bacterium]
MTIAEISLAASAVAPVQSANALTAGQSPQPRQEALQFGGFRLNYDPQNRELFLVYISPESGVITDQIPGFQTVTSRRNSTTAAPSALPTPSPTGGSAPSAAPASAASGAPGAGAAAAAAVAAASAPASRGGAVNIAS